MSLRQTAMLMLLSCWGMMVSAADRTMSEQSDAQTLVQEWDKTFPQSDKVEHSKVVFHNRYGITLAADLYKPKNAQGRLSAIAVEAVDVPTAEADVRSWIEQSGIGKETERTNAVRITAGRNTFEGVWLDTPLANEIRGMFPLTATLGRYGGREYYGSMPQRPTVTEEGQLHFENGDITYCPANNSIAIFYAKADDPSMGTLGMRVIPIGKVTSDLGIFDEMDSRLEFTFDDVQ